MFNFNCVIYIKRRLLFVKIQEYHIISAGSLLGVTIHEGTIKEFLKLYYYVGGMPEVVNAYATNKDLKEVRKIQKELLAAYEQDFSKHAPSNIVPRIRQLWNNIPMQLAKEKKQVRTYRQRA